jgi:AcrR family transcriptional regulator
VTRRPRRNSLTRSDALKTSPRRAELLDRAYEFVLENGLTGLSLRPLAAATGTSPRVLLYLFGSKEGLVRELLERMRREQLALLVSGLGARPDAPGDQLTTTELVERMWSVLGVPEQRRAVRLTYEAFLASLRPDPGPWRGFAAEQLGDWLEVLRAAQRDTPAALADARATRALALIRGLLLDLLIRGEPGRVSSALRPC